jgi:hypothetical protein
LPPRGEREKVELFCAVDTLKSALGGEEATSQPQAINREGMWTTFHRLRQSKLPGLWGQFLHSIGYSSATEEPLFVELVNEVHFEVMIKERYNFP